MATWVTFKCPQCRKAVRRPKEFGRDGFCGDECRSRSEGRFGRYVISGKSRKRAVRKGDSIDRIILFNYHDWVCHLCDEVIDHTLRLPHPLAATIDHITPLGAGGKHTWLNVAPAHAYCNFQKGCAVA